MCRRTRVARWCIRLAGGDPRSDPCTSLALCLMLRCPLNTETGVGFGPVFTPSPASCSRTLIISTGWMTVVAVMPARPPLRNGSAARMKGVCKKSEVACLGFSAADFIADEASERTDSLVCFAFSTTREAGILKFADMLVSCQH